MLSCVQVLLLAVISAHAHLLSSSSPTLPVVSPLFCRDSWISNMTLEHFEKFTCAKCFVQVFFDHKILMMKFPPDYPYILYSKNNSNITFLPDPDEPDGACASVLSEEECGVWRSCCEAARKCCVGPQQTQSTGKCTCGITEWGNLGVRNLVTSISYARKPKG